MAEHKHGSMNTDAQEKAFAGFIGWATKGAIAAIGVLVFLAIFNS